MRNQWLRLLLLRSRTPSETHISQVHRIRSFASSLHHHRALPNPFFLIRRLYSSSELSDGPNKHSSHPAVVLRDVFSIPEKSNDKIRQELDSKNVVIDHNLVLSVLRNSGVPPDVAGRIFNWVLENHSDKLSSKSYNFMLGILGRNGLVKETWDLIEIMKKGGYGVKKGAFDKILERFQKDGLSDEVEKLKDLYASGSASSKNSNDDDATGNEIENYSSRISEIIGSKVWDGNVEKQLQNLGIEFSSDMVASVLEDLEMEPNKALIFFRWVQESGFCKHDKKTYNVMARVLGKEDHGQKFWRIGNEMKSKGYEMDRDTYVSVSQALLNRKMIKEAVDLFEFAILGEENKPSVREFTLLLKKIVVSKELDMDMFARVVQGFKASGSELTDAHLDAVVKSLVSVGRMNEFNPILALMTETGYQPGASLRSKIAFILSSGGKAEEAQEFMDNTVASEHSSDYGTWAAFVKGYCKNGDLKEAYISLQKMVENDGASHAKGPLDLLVGAYSQKNKTLEAYKLVVEMVHAGVRPWGSTFKLLTRKLLARKRFDEALDVMSLMKSQGYPPELNSFVEYLSRTGSAEDALTFTQAITTSKIFPSTSVYIRLFEAYLNAGRLNEAQDFLSKCPRYIKNHADILELFSSQEPGSIGITSAVSV